MELLKVVLIMCAAGASAGFAVSAGVARMFKAPEVQALGAFRTLGEINSCNADPASHFAFGAGFLLNSAATAVGTGVMTSDVLHRIIPNWAIGAYMTITKRSSFEEMSNTPFQIGVMGALIGGLLLPALVTLSAYVPPEFGDVAQAILVPAATFLFFPIMPVIFLLAAFDSNKHTGMISLVFGAFSHILMSNPLPGIVFGIMLGEIGKREGYKSKSFLILLTIIVVMMIIIGHLRGIEPSAFIKFTVGE